MQLLSTFWGFKVYFGGSVSVFDMYGHGSFPDMVFFFIYKNMTSSSSKDPCGQSSNIPKMSHPLICVILCCYEEDVYLWSSENI